ncbi:MAG: queuosine precursor transporter [Desulfovibrionaceae bacterium]
MFGYNELLWCSFLLFDMFIVVFAFYFFGKIGLFCCIVLNVIIANLQVVKIVELFTLTTTLGNILYASVFLATDALGELYGKKEAKKAVLFGFFAISLMTIYMQVALVFVPAPIDFAQKPLEELFSFIPRIVLASMLAYLLSQSLDLYIYHKLRIYTTRYLWLRNNVSTILGQFLDSIVFSYIAFWGIFPFIDFIEIVFTTFFFKSVVAVFDTPFLYLIRKIHILREKDIDICVGV